MKLADAKKECVQWLAYVGRQRDRSIAVQKIAAEVRSGDITSDDGRRKLQTLDGAKLQVYDGARLEQAVKVLLRTLPRVEDVAHVSSHGCLQRQVELLRADRLPPPVMVASGATGEEGCVD